MLSSDVSETIDLCITVCCSVFIVALTVSCTDASHILNVTVQCVVV